MATNTDYSQNITSIRESIAQLTRAAKDRGLETLPELRDVTRHVGDLAKAMGHQTFGDGEQQEGQENGQSGWFGGRFNPQQLQQFYSGARQRMNGAVQYLGGQVRENPVRTISIAIAAGTAVGLAVFYGRRRGGE